jgi:hypothetical protein
MDISLYSHFHPVPTVESAVGGEGAVETRHLHALSNETRLLAVPFVQGPRGTRSVQSDGAGRSRATRPEISVQGTNVARVERALQAVKSERTLAKLGVKTSVATSAGLLRRPWRVYPAGPEERVGSGGWTSWITPSSSSHPFRPAPFLALFLRVRQRAPPLLLEILFFRIERRTSGGNGENQAGGGRGHWPSPEEE